MVRMRDWTNHSPKQLVLVKGSFKTDPSQATSARAANESGSYLCASNVTPTAVRFIVSVFLCLLCSCRMSSTQMTCSHFRKNRPNKRQKTAGCRSRIISKNRPVPIFGRSTGASLVAIEGKMNAAKYRDILDENHGVVASQQLRDCSWMAQPEPN